MNKIPLNKNTALSVLLAVVCVVIAIRITPVSVDPVIKLIISKNSVNITHIDQARNIESTKEVWVDIINLAEKNRFQHPKLGEIGYASEFFVDIDAPFTIKQAGNYQFMIASDDGFKLSIDGKQLCSFPGSRGIATQTCNVTLTEGTHNFQLSYYQGYGHAGLKAQYTKVSSNKTYWVGENSAALRFD
jgi:hypothetical protein